MPSATASSVSFGLVGPGGARKSASRRAWQLELAPVSCVNKVVQQPQLGIRSLICLLATSTAGGALVTKARPRALADLRTAGVWGEH